ncbi:MAG: NAD(P)/FAD-dependent oxidoreductase [Acetobacteraceae bacterium]|nr:NAD(P)/FAD-dependent oxidoreductase [Acetobacteraceae bacterium]
MTAPGIQLGRRGLFALGAGGIAAATLPQAARARERTTARIVIAGAGAAGITMAARLSQRLEGARITVLDRRERHVYQPGLTLVGSGVWTPEKVISTNAQWMPRGVAWIREAVAEFDPVGNKVVTDTGRQVPYDFLVVAAGIELNYAGIEGMSEALIGREGIGSVYAGPEAAAATWREMARVAERGGVLLHGRPATEMKCAGAPLKLALLSHARLARAGTRGRSEIVYNAHNDATFSVPAIHRRVVELFGERGIRINYGHVLKAVDPGRKIATYRTANGEVELRYDFIHVVPPQRTPAALRNSPLPWQSGPLAADGWVEADRRTLRHPRFPNVFTVGDATGVPRGKTAATVKKMTPVATDNLVDVIAGREPRAAFNGYTSCPLITDIGRAMLVEFDYEGRLVPSFPFVDPLRESWFGWLVKDQLIHAVYEAMLGGWV